MPKKYCKDCSLPAIYHIQTWLDEIISTIMPRLKLPKRVETFFESLGSNPGKTFLGGEDVKRALNTGAVETLFLSGSLSISEKKNFIEMANNTGSDVKIISRETGEGEQFYNMGGIGAILRFKI